MATFYDVVCNDAKIGIKFNGTVVEHIFAGLWAERTGTIHTDDEIVSVETLSTMASADGLTDTGVQDLTNLPQDERMQILVQTARPMKLRFKRPAPGIFHEAVLEKHDRKLGMKFEFTGSENRVKEIHPHGWANRNGVHINDEIYSIGGVSFGAMSKDERMKTLLETRPLLVCFKRCNFAITTFTVNFTDQHFGFSLKGKTSSVVKHVDADGCAEKSGIRSGDEMSEIMNHKTGVWEPYASMSDHEKAHVFHGPRPLCVKFTRKIARVPYYGHSNGHSDSNGHSHLSNNNHSSSHHSNHSNGHHSHSDKESKTRINYIHEAMDMLQQRSISQPHMANPNPLAPSYPMSVMQANSMPNMNGVVRPLVNGMHHGMPSNHSLPSAHSMDSMHSLAYISGPNGEQMPYVMTPNGPMLLNTMQSTSMQKQQPTKTWAQYFGIGCCAADQAQADRKAEIVC